MREDVLNEVQLAMTDVVNAMLATPPNFAVAGPATARMMRAWTAFEIAYADTLPVRQLRWAEEFARELEEA